MDGYFPEVRPLGHSDFPRMPWTIEQQLHSYAMSPQHTERHEILWNSWLQDHRWLSELLEYTVFSAPMYSRHNASHCEAVIHNIECLLGEDEIRRLSATDCFAILVSVYLHDIGMVTTSYDREKALKDDSFGRFIVQLKQSADPNMRWAAEVFSAQAKQEAAQKKDPVASHIDAAHTQHQYDIYRAVVLLLAEYQRKQHADISAGRVEQWIKDPGKLQSGLLMTGIPIRIFLQIAACARMHGEFSFDAMMKTLPQYDDGYTQDTYHPMFIGVLLALGDILDLDNERFNPFIKDVLGDDLFPAKSQMHYRKHQAIRSLRITPKSIQIEADCCNSEELRQLCQEVDWLEGFLKNCSYHWAAIAPDNFCGCLPVVKLSKVCLNGEPIPASLVTTKFELSQKKAFHLLSGANLYERRFPFLRELLQNAIDAVKLQYWTDYSASELGATEKMNLCEANLNLPFKKYPIHIDVAVKKRKKNSQEQLLEVTADDLAVSVDDFLREYEFGVEVRVQDCGIGISAKDIEQISKVGSSHEHRLEQISKLPEWLRPTGHFGIGLQSLFLVDDHFQCVTRTRTGECYQMTFHSGEKAEGYINIIPRTVWNMEQGDIPYGTCFSVFVPERHKISHTKDMTGWLGMDPYQENYSKYRKLRRSIELMIQIEADINALIGERLFPIITREQELDESLEEMIRLKDKHRSHIGQESHDYSAAWQSISANTRRLERKEQDERYCWLFQEEISAVPKFQRDQLSDGSVYYFDVAHGRLYGWSQHAECFFCCSARRILKLCEQADRDDGVRLHPKSVRLFIKGLFVTDISCSENDLFEYIDIKNDSLQNFLQMNRDGLTADGIQKLNTEIIPQIQKTFHLILQRINAVNLDSIRANQQYCLKKFPAICEQVLAPYAENPNHSFDVSAVVKKYKKRIENISLFAFSCSALKSLPSINQIYLRDKEWNDFFESVSFQFFPGLKERLHKAFEEQLGNHVEEDLTSRLLETLWQKIWDTCSRAAGQAISTLDKTALDRFRRDLAEIHQIIFLSALCFFYANTGRPQDGNSCAGNAIPCSWEYLNRSVSRVLKYADEVVVPRLIPLTEFKKQWKRMLFLPCIDENQIEKLHQKFTIADLMLRGNRFAVYSTRSSQQGHWKHMLIHLTPLGKTERLPSLPDDATVIELLNARPSHLRDCRLRVNLLNQWHDHTINRIYLAYVAGTVDDRSNTSSYSSRLWENLMTCWFVKNLPSVSVGSDPAGNNRINVLSFHAPKQLFLNTNVINLLLNRMQNKYGTHNVQRMCTTTWDGLEALCTKDDITTNILRVDRGKISSANKKATMLMAFPSVLPAKDISLPNGQKLAEVNVQTTYDLLLWLREVYTQGGNAYGFTDADDVLSCCTDIVEFLKINVDGIKAVKCAKDDSEQGDRASKNDGDTKTLLERLQDRFREQSEKNVNNARGGEMSDVKETEKARTEFFLDNNRKRLQSGLLQLYLSIYEDFYMFGTEKQAPVSNSDFWSQVDLPDELDRYLNSLLIHLFGFEVEDAQKWEEFSDYKIYSSTTEFLDNVHHVFEAARYLFQHAYQQYQEEFLDNICHWWKNAVWASDPGQKAFIEYTKKHLQTGLENHQIQDLYTEQIRIMVRAQISVLNSPIDHVLGEVSVFRPIANPQ